MFFWSILYAKTFRNEWCLDKIIGPIENDLERGFVKHWLNCVEITGSLSLSLTLLLAKFKQLRRRRRQCQKTIGFMSKTTGLHMHHAF